MNLSTSSVKGLGVLVSGVLLLSTGIFVINPLLEERSGNLSDLKSLQVVTETKKENLTRLTNGAVNADEARRVGQNFQKIVAKDKNIESASRAISEAIVPGVTITSFTFNPEEPVTPNTLPPVSLEGYKPPASFVASSANAAKPAAESKSSLNRLPLIVSVSAQSYQKLSEYVDQLSKEDRLLSVISISAASKDGSVKADIYAFAFIDKSK